MSHIYICVSNRDFWKCVFALWSHKYSWNKNSAGQPGSIRGRLKTVGWVIDVLKLISLSRSGLRRSEIVHLLSLLGYRARATVTFSDWDMFYVRMTSDKLIVDCFFFLFSNWKLYFRQLLAIFFKLVATALSR